MCFHKLTLIKVFCELIFMKQQSQKYSSFSTLKLSGVCPHMTSSHHRKVALNKFNTLSRLENKIYKFMTMLGLGQNPKRPMTFY